MALYSSVAIFAIALVFILWRPRGINEAFFALAGALLLFWMKLLVPGDAAYIWGLVWNATFSLIGIMIFTALLDRNGFFRWAALHIVSWFHHRQLRLLAGLSLLAACITVFFNNDGTILIMIPIVLEVTALLNLPRRTRIAFLLSVGFMADTASAPLMMSNLTNIITADFFELSFWEYARNMFIPGVTAIGATVIVMMLCFGGEIRRGEKRLEAPRLFPNPASVVIDRRLFRLSWGIIGLMMAGYLFSETMNVPVAAVALAGAAVQWIASAAAGQAKVRETMARAPWLIVVFALAMNLLVYSMHVYGAVAWFPAVLEPVNEYGSLSGVVGSGILFSLLAAVVNNLPAVLIASLSIEQVNGPDYLKYASLLGTSIGAKLSPIGSLATLLWLQLLRRDGIVVGWREYTKYGILLTIPILLSALIMLWLTGLME